MQDEVVLVDGLAVQGDLHRPEPGEVVLGDVGRGHRQRCDDHGFPVSPPAGALDLVVPGPTRSEEHTSELQSLTNLVCRLLLEKKKKKTNYTTPARKTR